LYKGLSQEVFLRRLEEEARVVEAEREGVERERRVEMERVEEIERRRVEEERRERESVESVERVERVERVESVEQVERERVERSEREARLIEAAEEQLLREAKAREEADVEDERNMTMSSLGWEIGDEPRTSPDASPPPSPPRSEQVSRSVRIEAEAREMAGRCCVATLERELEWANEAVVNRLMLLSNTSSLVS